MVLQSLTKEASDGGLCGSIVVTENCGNITFWVFLFQWGNRFFAQPSMTLHNPGTKFSI